MSTTEGLRERRPDWHDQQIYPHNPLSSVACPRCLWDLAFPGSWRDSYPEDVHALAEKAAKHGRFDD